MKEADAHPRDRIRRPANPVDRSLMTFESASDVVSKNSKVSDGFAVAHHIIARMRIVTNS